MRQVTEASELLKTLGQRLRAARLERNEPMALFAERLGVAERTVRAMERGAPTVQIGTWLKALWVLDRLSEIQSVLEPRESLLDRARAESKGKRPRQRASRRPRSSISTIA